MSRLTSVLVLALFTSLCTASIAFSCPSTTLYDAESAACLPVRDLSRQVRHNLDIPNLVELRRAHRHAMLPRGFASEEGLPIPGGIGTGTTYNNGQLQATAGANLTLTMFVQPDGLNPSGDGLEWLFTTATNRTDDTLEIVGIYNEANPGAFGIFDWSCSTDSPCAGNVITPSWVYTTPMTALPCNITQMTDLADIPEQAMRYQNVTMQTPTGWENIAYLRNYCNGGWDIIYSHAYTGALTDCSLASACGWWGPILETFPIQNGAPIPQINQLGFQSIALIINGKKNRINATLPTTTFTYPINPWKLFFVDPLRDYVIGNNLN